MAALSFACILRNLALPRPFVFGDELLYSLLTKFAGREALLHGNPLVPPLPNALYFHLYKLAFLFGDNYLEGAKILNACFWGVALLGLYGGVALLRSGKTATLVTAIVGLGPASVYAACFMPEVMHFCAVSLAIYCFLRYVYSRPMVAVSLSGVCLGCDILIKPHGLILIVPWLLSFIFLKLSFYQDFPWRRLGAMMLSFLFTIAASIAVLNFFLTGEFTMGLGSGYGPMVSRSAAAGAFGPVLHLMGEHLAAISSLYALPLLVIGWQLLRRSTQATERTVRLRSLLLLTATCLLAFIFTTSKFTVAMWPADSPEQQRLHGRYYFFMLPWVLASFFCAYPEFDWSKRRVKAFFSASAILAAAIAGVAIVRLGPSHIMPFIDFADIFWFYPQKTGLWRFFVALVTVGTLMVYAAFRPSSRLYGGTIAILAIIGSIWTSSFLLGLTATPADAAGSVFKPLLNPETLDRGAVVVPSGSDTEAYRLMFHLLGAYDVIVQEGATPEMPVTSAAVGENRPWVIVAGSRKAQFPYTDSLSIGRYGLYLQPGGASALYVPSSKSPAPQEKDKAATGRVDMENVARGPGQAVCHIDILGTPAQALASSSQNVAAGLPVYISGWAIDQTQNLPAAVVTIFFDKQAYTADYGQERPDVATHFKSRLLLRSGFAVSIPPSDVVRGTHTVSVRVVSNDRKVYWDGTPISVNIQ